MGVLSMLTVHSIDPPFTLTDWRRSASLREKSKEGSSDQHLVSYTRWSRLQPDWPSVGHNWGEGFQMWILRGIRWERQFWQRPSPRANNCPRPVAESKPHCSPIEVNFLSPSSWQINQKWRKQFSYHPLNLESPYLAKLLCNIYRIHWPTYILIG